MQLARVVGVEVDQVLAHLGQPADHPYALNHPEGFYLKGLWLSVS